ELGEGARLARGELDRAHAGDRLLEVAVQAADPLPDLPVCLPRHATEEVDGEHHERQQREARERQPEVDPEHERDDADEPEHVEHDGHRARGEHLLEHVDVGREPRDDPPDRVLVEEAHREALELREERHAEVREAPLRDHRRQVLLAVLRQELGDDDPDVDEAERREAGEVPRDDVVVDPALQEVRLERGEEPVHGREEDGRPEDRPIRADVRPEAADQAGVVRLPELLLAEDVRHQIASSSPSRACWRKSSAYARPRARSVSWSPTSTTRPSSRTTIRSASFTVLTRCATMTVVRSRKNPRSASSISRSVAASTAESASSRTRTRGDAASTRASATRCFWPPESVIPRSPTRVSRPAGISARSRPRPAMRTAHPTRPSASSSAKATFSRSVREKRNGSWGTRPICRRSQPSGSVRTSRPSRRTVPASTSKRRGRSWTRALFPAPVRPTIATVFPAGIVSVTPSSTWGASFRPGKRKVTSRSAISPRKGASGSAAGGLAIAGSTAKSAFKRCMAARPRWRMVSIQPIAIVGQAR